MNIYKELVTHEVFPALGCTEPIAVAYAAAVAAAQLGGEVKEVRIEVDPGVFKNGFAVTVPNTGGERGTLIAGALGALIARPELNMEILKGINESLLARAKDLLAGRRVTLAYDDKKVGLYIDVTVKSSFGTARAVLEGGHTNLVRLEKDGIPLVDAAGSHGGGKGHAYRERLRGMTIAGMIDLVERLDGEDLAYLRRGVEMNLALAEVGKKLGKVGHFVADLVSKGLLVDDVVSTSKILTASASDARMAGLPYPAMEVLRRPRSDHSQKYRPLPPGERLHQVLHWGPLAHLRLRYRRRGGRGGGDRLPAVGKGPREDQPGGEHPGERPWRHALRRGKRGVRPQGGQLHGVGHPRGLHGPEQPRHHRGGGLCRPNRRGDHKEHEPDKRDRHVSGGRDHAGDHAGKKAVTQAWQAHGPHRIQLDLGNDTRSPGALSLADKRTREPLNHIGEDGMLKMSTIQTDQAPKAIGPYSQAIRAGDFVFCSGQIPLDPQSGEMVSGGIAAQTRQVMNNLAAILRAAGCDFSTVVKTTIFLGDLKDFSVVNEVYGEYFKGDPPARATIQVAALPRGSLVEIEAVALVR